jgi:hypothetical protein
MASDYASDYQRLSATIRLYSWESLTKTAKNLSKIEQKTARDSCRIGAGPGRLVLRAAEWAEIYHPRARHCMARHGGACAAFLRMG